MSESNVYELFLNKDKMLNFTTEKLDELVKFSDNKLCFFAYRQGMTIKQFTKLFSIGIEPLKKRRRLQEELLKFNKKMLVLSGDYQNRCYEAIYKAIKQKDIILKNV